MVNNQSHRLATSCSLALRLVDAYTGTAPLQAGLQLTLVGTARKPLKKPDGFIIYTNIPDGVYSFELISRYYFPVIQQMELGGDDPYRVITLFPNASYPFGQRATYIRVSLLDERRNPVSGVTVDAVCTSEDSAKAQLSQETNSGENIIQLANIKGKVTEGDTFLIKDKGNSAYVGEYCSIAREIDGFRTFKLEEPLKSTFVRGASLYYSFHTQSDSSGEAVIPFRNPPSSLFEVQLVFKWKDITLSKEVALKEQQAFLLETIHLGEN